ncbi:hypothetical protein SISNIDRAFT_180023 [Sistotremastrum niveocremeum HHB9708]|uniref:SEN1 N terminal-domain-containing protein n=1 Tax=Sistotremastrum niveocremeum HHB9708 TaxID=1314777 RepID=A0A164RDA0_9AGAM|nr:hypothetical protein SISNIDRAFT_180023 [Sistotremastrum niveocremeum HHB9708]
MASKTRPATAESDIEKTLERLRAEPADATGTPDSLIAPIYTLLLAEKPGADGVLHWYCPQARPVVRESAIFLIRLFAYDSNPRVNAFKSKLRSVVDSCCQCSDGFQLAKVTSRTSYLGAFKKHILDQFMAAVDSWEIASIQIVLDSETAQATGHPILAFPGTLYSILANPHVLSSPRIMTSIESSPPSALMPSWPSQPPPGLLALLFHPTENIRSWAVMQIKACKRISWERWFSGYDSVLVSLVQHLSAMDHSFATGGVNSSPLAPTFSCTMEESVFWKQLLYVLERLPSDILAEAKGRYLKLSHTMFGHLHGSGASFQSVLRCSMQLVSDFGREVWVGEAEDYPQIVFDSIKDNLTFIKTFEAVPTESQKHGNLFWFPPFLRSIWSLPVLPDVLAKMSAFAFEELQHERFENSRPVSLNAILNTLSEFHTQNQKSELQVNAIKDVVERHLNIISSVAFASTYSGAKWNVAREASRGLLTHLVRSDLVTLERQVSQAAGLRMMSKVIADASAIPYLQSRPLLWKKIYSSIHSSDRTAIRLMLSLVAKTSFLDKVAPSAYGLDAKSQAAPVVKAMNTWIASANHLLVSSRDGFRDIVVRFCDTTTPKSLAEFLHEPDVVSDLLMLLISPVDDLREAALAIIGNAFDVDVRASCLRALLDREPQETFDGLEKALGVFNSQGKQLLEACNFARSMVLCLTDVMEALCARPDGYLFSSSFKKGTTNFHPSTRILGLWRSMTTTVTVIYSRTPLWSAYYEPSVMIVWMIDASSFAADLVDRRKDLESAASTDSGAGGTIAKRMIDSLQPVLLEVIRWLRLTDPELLDRSYALVQALIACFRENGVIPQREAIAKLERFVSGARGAQKESDRNTRLTDVQLTWIYDAITEFDEDEVKVISRSEFRPAAPSKPSIPQKKDGKGATEPTAKSSGAAIALPPSGTTSTSRSRGINGVGKDIALQVVKGKESSRGRDARPLVRPPGPPVPRSGSSASSRSRSPPARIMRNEARQSTSTKDEESSSDDSEDESRGTLSLLGEKSPRVKKPTERRQIKRLDIPIKGGSAAHQRFDRRDEAQRTALRLKPDISPLHKQILSWDYNHDGSEPPDFNNAKLQRVLQRYPSHEKYGAVFEPLLILECWSQIQRAKEENAEAITCKVETKAFVDDWMDLDLTTTEGIPAQYFVAETDIILLRSCSGPQNVLAKVQGSKRTPAALQISVRCRSRAPGAAALVIGDNWRLSKIFSLSTVHREYAALKALPYYDFYDDIIHARVSKPVRPSRDDITKAMKNHMVNEPQAVAILSAMKTSGFSLIQGPPGTGKTSTICGLVGSFMSNRPRAPTAIHAGRTSSDKAPVRKILLCAPSNAAIDEVAKRVRDGVRDANGVRVVPSVVRVGADKSVNISVKDITLDQLVEQKLQTDKSANSNPQADSELSNLRFQMDAIKKERQQKQELLASIKDNATRADEVQKELQSLMKKRMALSTQFDKLKDKQKSDHRALDANRRRARIEVLSDADVICSTLSGAGHEILEQFDFEMIIIDEAAQSIELSSLIPLKYRCKRCVMVGDPKQLPPTVISPKASEFLYNQSLFVRLEQQTPDAVHLLSIQYRMHPDISRLPSTLFYDGRLEDGPGMAAKTTQGWHSSPMFRPYRFFDVHQGIEKESTIGHSQLNVFESAVAVALYDRLLREFTGTDFDYRIGIISMYSAQVAQLKRDFQRRFGHDIVSKIDFNTVDGFQGQEKDIIILSCVRAGPRVTSVGFLSDQRRMNVSFTRSRSSLFVLGNAATLERSDPVWRNIVHDARDRNALTPVDPGYFQRPTTSNHALSSSSSPSSKPPSSKKQKLSGQYHGPPAGLATPKQLKNKNAKSSGQHPAAPKSPSLLQRLGPPVNQQAELSVPMEGVTETKVPETSEDVIMADRPLKSSAVEQTQTPQDQPTNHSMPTQQPPAPLRKPKPKPPPSLFIPKNKNLKRPAPLDTPGASGSTIKKRLMDQQ